MGYGKVVSGKVTGGKVVSGPLALVASLALAMPVAAQNTAPLAPGEVLLQLQQKESVIEPLGSIRTSCTLSATGPRESTAHARLTAKRYTLPKELGKLGIPATAIVQFGTSSVEPDYSAAAAAANAAANAAVDAAAAAGGEEANAAEELAAARKNAKSAAAIAADEAVRAAAEATFEPDEDLTYKATQTVSFRFTRYAQIIKADAMADLECMPTAYSQVSGFPVAEPIDPPGAAFRAQEKVMTEARKRADLYAASMGMKVLRIQRVSEVGELGSLIGPEVANDFRRLMTMGRGGFDADVMNDKVKVEKGLFIDFVLAPK